MKDKLYWQYNKNSYFWVAKVNDNIKYYIEDAISLKKEKLFYAYLSIDHIIIKKDSIMVKTLKEAKEFCQKHYENIANMIIEDLENQ